MNGENKRESVEERVITLTQSKVNKINTFSSQIFYASIILLNILTLILSILYINNIAKIEKFSIVVENIKIEFVALIILIFIFMMCLKTLPNFLKVYSMTKKCRFGLLYSAESVRNFYNMSTIYSTGATSMYVDYLVNRKVSEKNSLDVAYSRNLFERIAHTIFYSIAFIVGLIFWLKKDLSWWLLICASIPIIINLIVLCVIFSFKVNKKSTIKFVANICTIMYNLHLTKNYEKLYTKITDNLILYDKQFKQNKTLIFTEIVSYMLTEFLKCVLVYYVLVSLNLGSIDMLGDVIFRVVLIEMILLLYPFRNGCLIFEILFVMLFKNVFFEGYIFWGMLITRLVLYFFYMIQYYLLRMCSTMQRNKKAS